MLAVPVGGAQLGLVSVTNQPQQKEREMKGNRLLIAAITAIAMNGSVAAADSVLKVLHQGNPDRVKMYQEVAKRFEAANPGVKVELIYTPHDSYDQKVSSVISAKQMPDVLELDAPFLANYVWSGHLVPLKPYVDKDLLSDMTASSISSGTYPIDKELYAMGPLDSTVVLYGNRKYLSAINARIPKGVDDAWTAEEFQSNMQKLAAVPGVKWPLDIGKSFGITSEWVTYAYSPALQSAGCDLINRSTWKSVGTLDSAPCVKTLSMWQDWVKKGWVVPASAGGNALFSEGNPAALAWGGHWLYPNMAKAMGENLIVMPLPKFGAKSASPNGTWIWSITKASKNPQLAGKFLSFFFKDKAYREFLITVDEFPGLKSFAAAAPNYSGKGNLVIAAEQSSKSAVSRPAHPAYPTITSSFMKAVDTIFNGADVQKKLTETAAKIDAEIEENGGYPPFNGK